MAYKIEEISSWTDEYLVEEYLACRETHQFWVNAPDHERLYADIENMEVNIRNIRAELVRRRIPIPPFP